jgi:hypothetical protein
MASDVEALLARVAGEHSWNWATLQCTCGAQALKVAPIGDASFEESHIIAAQAAALREWVGEQVEAIAEQVCGKAPACATDTLATRTVLAALADAIGGDQ